MNRCPHCGHRLPRQLHYLPPSHGRESVVGVILITAGYGAVSYMLIHLGWPWTRMLFWPVPTYPEEVPRLIVGAAMWGVWLALIGIGSTTLYWLEERRRPEPRQTRYDASVTFMPTATNSMRRLPDGVDEFRLWQYLVNVARGRVTLSQEGAAEHGFDRDQSNEIKDWLIAVGWWHWTNEANATGEWTDEGGRVLNMLSRPVPALWQEIVDPPTDDDA